METTSLNLKDKIGMGKQNEFSKNYTLELHFKINFEYMYMADDQRIHFK